MTVLQYTSELNLMPVLTLCPSMVGREQRAVTLSDNPDNIKVTNIMYDTFEIFNIT